MLLINLFSSLSAGDHVCQYDYKRNRHDVARPTLHLELHGAHGKQPFCTIIDLDAFTYYSQVFLLNLYIALIYGLLYIWFESFVIVFIEIYGFGLGEEGLAFLGILVGALIVMPPFFCYLYFVLEPKFDEDGNLTPEKRLPPCFVGAFCIPICLFWFGWRSVFPSFETHEQS